MRSFTPKNRRKRAILDQIQQEKTLNDQKLTLLLLKLRPIADHLKILGDSANDVSKVMETLRATLILEYGVDVW